MAEERKAWYVLRAISGKEAKVKEILDAAINNQTDLGQYLCQVLIPTEQVYENRNGKKVLRQRTLYSGYIFVEIKLVPMVSASTQRDSEGKEVENHKVVYQLSGEVESELKNTTNVIDFLRGRAKGSKPERLPESQVMRMLGTVDTLTQGEEEADMDFTVGENVKVTFGPFNGFHGIVREVNKDRKKLKVEVKIFERPVDLELETSQVERE